MKKGNNIAKLVGDAYREVPAWSSATIPNQKVSVLAAALDIFSKGSKYRQDTIDIINGCYPYYFKNEKQQ